ncbi:MAG TPA: ATP synthase F1 subunit gamma [Thermoguttaceae bacterium]|nr:ATP synthase F1 subunit gamma [Thermoguttaceae bacterium]
MAKARALDRRRKSIRGIRKITRTMELISTARFRRAMQRATAAADYTERITKLVADLAHSGLEVTHPLLEPRAETRRALLLVLSANRGMCAGYNGNIVRLASARFKELRKDVPEVRLEVSGKRGISAFRFRKTPPDEAFLQFEDRPAYDEVELLANRYLDDFRAGRIDRLDVAYTKFESFSRQSAVVETLLPLARPEENNRNHRTSAAETFYEFLPSAESLLEEVVPMSFRVRLFKCFLDAAVSEQIARMIAMKAATENADTMISNLSMAYNRARQGQITGELLEVISGAEALNG